jgi:cobalt-zinc-cadmium efflux system outer membrane protein
MTMRTSPWVCALALCSAASALAAQRPAGGQSPPRADTLRLTRSQAIASAVLHNPQVDVAREQLAQVRAQRVQGNAIPDPQAALSYDDQTKFLNLGTAGSKNLGATLTVPFPDKFRLHNNIGTAAVQSSEAQFKLVQHTIASAAARIYDSLLVTRRHRRDLTDTRSLAADFLTRTQARFNAGSVPRLDVIRAQVDLAQADNDLIANSRDVANAEAAMNRMLGRPLGFAIVQLDSLEIVADLPPVDALEARALASRPELSDLDAQIRGAKANSSLVREQAFLPDLTFGANKDYLSDQGTLYTAGLALPLPIFFWQHTRGEFAETKHRELELAATLRDTRAAVGQDVRVAFATADAARRQAVFIRDQLLPAASEAYRVASVSYGLGGLSAIEVLDARRDLIDAQRQLADALAAAASARADLERAIGGPLSSVPNGDPRE